MKRFLREPELFPGRISGETWGVGHVAIALAGETFVIEGLSAAQKASVIARYDALDAARAQHRIRLFRAAGSDFVDIDTRGWEYTLDLQWTRSGFIAAGMQLMARVDGADAGVWTSIDDRDAFWGVLENVLRPWLADRLLARGGLLVHSAAVDGFLFPGRSGAGKSTIAQLGVDAGLPVLSDDLNALANGLLLPLPFTGEVAATATGAAPLRAIVALEHGDRESLRALSLTETIALLLRCSPYVNLDAARTDALLDRASEIARSVPRATLRFRRNGDVWPILRTLS